MKSLAVFLAVFLLGVSVCLGQTANEIAEDDDAIEGAIGAELSSDVAGGVSAISTYLNFNCPAGYRCLPVLECLPCDYGSYKSDTSSKRCTQCPTGCTTLRKGASSWRECVPMCPPGYETSECGKTCVKCHPGYFKSTWLNDKCTQCPAWSNPDTVTLGMTAEEECYESDDEIGSSPSPEPTEIPQTTWSTVMPSSGSCPATCLQEDYDAQTHIPSVGSGCHEFCHCENAIENGTFTYTRKECAAGTLWVVGSYPCLHADIYHRYCSAEGLVDNPTLGSGDQDSECKDICVWADRTQGTAYEMVTNTGCQLFCACGDYVEGHIYWQEMQCEDGFIAVRYGSEIVCKNVTESGVFCEDDWSSSTWTSSWSSSSLSPSWFSSSSPSWSSSWSSSSYPSWSSSWSSSSYPSWSSGWSSSWSSSSYPSWSSSWSSSSYPSWSSSWSSSYGSSSDYDWPSSTWSSSWSSSYGSSSDYDWSALGYSSGSYSSYSGWSSSTWSSSYGSSSDYGWPSSSWSPSWSSSYGSSSDYGWPSSTWSSSYGSSSDYGWPSSSWSSSWSSSYGSSSDYGWPSTSWSSSWSSSYGSSSDYGWPSTTWSSSWPSSSGSSSNYDPEICSDIVAVTNQVLIGAASECLGSIEDILLVTTSENLCLASWDSLICVAEAIAPNNRQECLDEIEKLFNQDSTAIIQIVKDAIPEIYWPTVDELLLFLNETFLCDFGCPVNCTQDEYYAQRHIPVPGSCDEFCQCDNAVNSGTYQWVYQICAPGTYLLNGICANPNGVSCEGVGLVGYPRYLSEGGEDDDCYQNCYNVVKEASNNQTQYVLEPGCQSMCVCGWYGQDNIYWQRMSCEFGHFVYDGNDYVCVPHATSDDTYHCDV